MATTTEVEDLEKPSKAVSTHVRYGILAIIVIATALVSRWFPTKERGLATGAYTAGEYVGLAIAAPLLAQCHVDERFRGLPGTGLAGYGA